MKQVANPTGKGGFRDNPQNIGTGSWKKEDSIGYQYNKIIRLPFKELKNFQPETVAQKIAYQRVTAAISDQGLQDTKEITDRTEGKAPQSIDVTSDGNELKPILVKFIGVEDVTEDN